MASDHPYTVIGKWPFPLDMLRHDQSCAASADDQALIGALSQEYIPDGFDWKAQTRVNLVIPDAGRWRPNVARWESFGWSVSDKDDETRRSYKEAAARQRKREELRRSALAKLTPEEADALRNAA